MCLIAPSLTTTLTLRFALDLEKIPLVSSGEYPMCILKVSYKRQRWKFVQVLMFLMPQAQILTRKY